MKIPHIMKHWYWAALTHKGVYLGEVTGEMEPGETMEQAMLCVTDIIKKRLPQVQDVPKILAVMVSESRIYIDSEYGELIEFDVSLEFERG